MQAFHKLLDFFRRTPQSTHSDVVGFANANDIGGDTLGESLQRLIHYRLIGLERTLPPRIFNIGNPGEVIDVPARTNCYVALSKLLSGEHLTLPSGDTRANIVGKLRSNNGVYDRTLLRLETSLVDSTFNKALENLERDGVVEIRDGNKVHLHSAYLKPEEASTFDLDETTPVKPEARMTSPDPTTPSPFSGILEIHAKLTDRLSTALKGDKLTPIPCPPKGERAAEVIRILDHAPYGVMSARELSFYLQTNESSLKTWAGKEQSISDNISEAPIYIKNIKGVLFFHAVNRSALDGLYTMRVHEEMQRLFVYFERPIYEQAVTPSMVEFFRTSGSRQGSDFLDKTKLPLPYSLAYAIKVAALGVGMPRKNAQSNAQLPANEPEEPEEPQAQVMQNAGGPVYGTEVVSNAQVAFTALHANLGNARFFEELADALTARVLAAPVFDEAIKELDVLLKGSAFRDMVFSRVRTKRNLDSDISALEKQLADLKALKGTLGG